MTTEFLATPDDPRLREYSHLADRDLLREKGLFVAEGRLVVQRVIDGGLSVRSVLVSDAAREALASTLSRLPANVPVYVCPANQFERVTGYNIHRGCLALVERPHAPTLDEVLNPAQIVVVLEDVTDADNVGSVFRNAAALGADAVLLSPATCDPLYRKAIRTSMAATLSVPFARVTDWPAGLTRLKDRGFAVVALSPQAPAETIEGFAVRARALRLALLAGTEGSGLSEGAAGYADAHVRIPMRPGVDSLNVSVAVGIALSHLGRR